MDLALRSITAVIGVVLLASCAYLRGQSSAIPETPVASASTSPAAPTATPSSAPSAMDGYVSDDEATALMGQCGVAGRVAAYFRIPSGNDYRDHLPAMGKSPEIEGVSGVFVVVYDDPVSAPILGHPGAGSPPPFSNVLCVITPSGGPIVYANVSREGMVLPPGAWVNTPESHPPTQSPSPDRSLGEVEAISIARERVSMPVSMPDKAIIWGWEEGPFGYLFARFAQSWGDPEKPIPDVYEPDAWSWAVIFTLPVEVCDPDSGCKTRTGLESVFLSSGGQWLYTSVYGPPAIALPTPQQGGEPIVDALELSISNGTTLAITLFVNGQAVGPLGPGAYEDPIDSTALPTAPWHVEARTPSGRLLTTLDVKLGDLWHTYAGPGAPSTVTGKATRVDLSCGRLDIWAGPPLAGPAPAPSFPPGDCDP